RVVRDPQVLRQVANVAPFAGALARGLRRPLGIQTHARATLGVRHRRLADVMTTGRDIRGEPRVVHLEQRVSGVEDDGADGRAAHDARVYRGNLLDRSVTRAVRGGAADGARVTRGR